jgi:hypothetical protein
VTREGGEEEERKEKGGKKHTHWLDLHRKTVGEDEEDTLKGHVRDCSDVDRPAVLAETERTGDFKLALAEEKSDEGDDVGQPEKEEDGVEERVEGCV